MTLVANLVAVGGDTSVGEVSLALPAVIGRSKQADVRLTHPLISRKHCEFSDIDGRVAVRDLGLTQRHACQWRADCQSDAKLSAGRQGDDRLDRFPSRLHAAHRRRRLPPEDDIVDGRQTVRVRETTLTTPADDDRAEPSASGHVST